MTPFDVQFLLSAAGRRWLQDLDVDDHNHLQVASRLRNHLTAPQAHAIIETLILRQKAAAKFPHAADMLFTRDGLEQASGYEIARYRAGRFQAAGLQTIIDLGCGIGGDALALAEHGCVIGVDLDYTRLQMARFNCRNLVGDGRLEPLLADFTKLNVPSSLDGFFFDPARRTEHGRRIYSVNAYRPPLREVDRWAAVLAGGGAKISPGVDYDQLPPSEVASADFISVNGDVKECVLWYGRLRRSVPRVAVLLPDMHILEAEPEIEQLEVTMPGRYLYEPDGAVIRAHLIAELGNLLDARQIDSQIAYLTADHGRQTPFAKRFELIDSFPFQLKRLRRYLRERKIGRVVIKKRGSPLDPDQLRQQLRLKGKGAATIFLTQSHGQPIVLIAKS